MNTGVELRFGWLCPSIKEQLEEQCILYKEDRYTLKDIENFRLSINKLILSDFMTDSEANRIFGRLCKHIASNCSPNKSSNITNK